MATARFTQLVRHSGRPENHLILSDPRHDRTLQRAIRQHRVLTVHQTIVGHQSDHAEVGFHPGPACQYLIFPRTLAPFQDRRIIGLKYDLLAVPKTPPRENKTPTPSPRKATRKTKATPTQKSPPPAAKTPRPRPARKNPHPPAATITRSVPQLKATVRRAIAHLEQGRQVAAFRLLQQIVDE